VPTRLVEIATPGIEPTANDFHDSVRDFMQELRVTSPTDGRLAWLAGLYYQDEDRTLAQDTPSPGFDALTGGAAASFGYPDNLFHADYRGTQTEFAVYGEVSYRFTPKWQVTLGARWFEFEYGLDDFFDGLFAGGSASLRKSSSEQGVTPKFGLVYKASDDILLYANAAEGYRPGGTNEFYDSSVITCAAQLAALGIGVPPRSFESDSVWNFELGAKARWLEGRLIANAAIYHIRWRDMQVVNSIDCVRDTIAFVENAGKASSDGVELELEWRPIEAIELTLGATYVNSRLTADVPDISGEDGESIPTVPDWTLSASASGEWALTDTMNSFARVDYRFTGGSWSDFDESVRRHQPSRQLVNLRAGVRVGHWEVDAFADNIFDERGVLLHTNNLVGEWEVLMQPRTVGVRLRLDF
jgi:outer membrane receptor protein involved in Fe transport